MSSLRNQVVSMSIEQLSPSHPLWPALIEHTTRHNMTRWIVDDQQRLLPECFCLGKVVDDKVVGHLVVRKQPLIIPATEWSQDLDHDLRDEGGRHLEELFVQTFAVNDNFRRQGIGSALQLAALQLGSDLKCVQLRSWSSLDKPENYSLKLRLGFCVHPAVDELPDGRKISGAYFVAPCLDVSHIEVENYT